MTKEKPTFDEFVQAVKDNFPKDAQITLTQINNLKKVWDGATREQLVEAYRYAQKYSPLTPLVTIYNQIGGDGIYRPSFNEKYHIPGKKVENGTDWDAKEEQFWESKQAEGQSYDRQHGRGAWGKKENIEKQKLHNFFVKIETESDKKARSSKEQYYESKEDKEWLDNLMKELAK